MSSGVPLRAQDNCSSSIVKDDPRACVGKDNYEYALALPVDVTDKPMVGWVLVASEVPPNNENLQRYVDRWFSYALSLPPK